MPPRTDFDNVAVDKEPGRSHEIEIRIVGLPALEAILNQAQAKVQQELLRLREQQRDALKRVDALEKQLRNSGRLRQEDLDNLVEAEQLQRQIRDRVGTRQEGLAVPRSNESGKCSAITTCPAPGPTSAWKWWPASWTGCAGRNWSRSSRS